MSALGAGSGSGMDSIPATYLPFLLLATGIAVPWVFLSPAQHHVVILQVDAGQR